MQKVKARNDKNETSVVMDAVSVPPVSPDEAATLATSEIDRLLSLLERLEASDWEKPTYCTLWNVRQVVSHIAGALSAYADWDRLIERSLPWTEGKAEQPGVAMPVFLADLAGMPEESRRRYAEAGMNPLDSLNQYEVDQRSGASPSVLIAEIRSIAPAAIENRLRLPGEVRSLLLPVAGAKAPVHYLLDVIYPRDIWMHRIELELSAGRPVARSAEHDGRLTALVMRDLARRLATVVENRSVVYRLTGPDGGGFRFGATGDTDVVLTMDTIDLHMLASERRSAADALERTSVTGDSDLARLVMKNTIVVY
jgi:uncharacterized protein (TIGR03083 family)